MIFQRGGLEFIFTSAHRFDLDEEMVRLYRFMAV